MYSEDESEIGVCYLDSNDAGSDIADVEGNKLGDEVERMIELREEDNDQIRYVFYFDDPLSPFQEEFATEIRQLDAVPDLTGVLDAEDSRFVAEREAAAAEARQPDLVHDGVPLRHAPGSRFLMNNMLQCILIPVDETINRKALVEQHASLGVDLDSEPLDFSVGYLKTVATGWALPRTTSPAVLAALKELYPGWRAPTTEDMAMFMRDFTSEGDDYLKEMQKQRRETMLMRYLGWRTRSAETFIEAVQNAGGWGRVRLVAFDVVSAVVLSRQVPLPLEMAFAEVPSPRRDAGSDEMEMHFLLHPGLVTDRDNACHGSVAIHGIPLDGFAFLSTCYAELARQVAERYLNDPRVILIFRRGSPHTGLIDVQGLRWLFAAAAVSDDSIEVPHPTALRCFDVSVVLEAIGQADEATLEATPQSDDEASGEATECGEDYPGCAYHTRVEQLWNIGARRCARRAALRLRDEIASTVKAGAPTWEG